MERNQENHEIFEAKDSSSIKPRFKRLKPIYARFDTIDFRTEIADEKMKLNVSKNVDKC